MNGAQVLIVTVGPKRLSGTKKWFQYQRLPREVYGGFITSVSAGIRPTFIFDVVFLHETGAGEA